MCDIFADMGELELAENLYPSVIQLCKTVRFDTSKIVQLHISLGELLLNQDKSEDTHDVYESANALCEKEDYTGVKYIDLLIKIGDLFYKKDDNEKTIQYFEKALGLLNNNYLKYKYAELFFKLSVCYAKIGSDKEIEYIRMYSNFRNPFN